ARARRSVERRGGRRCRRFPADRGEAVDAPGARAGRAPPV
ncbi:MAG: hypothetical protein AVDCRST_MAG85-4218, partial [uncultured Solirubrobacteraceae bacterium]